MPQQPILLVDDDLSLAQAMTTALEGRGLPVDHCASGEVAIELIQAKRYPLVVVDVVLGEGVSGIYVVNAIRKLPPARRPEVLMITGAGLENMRGIDRSVVAAVILKPLDFQLFAEYVAATYAHSAAKLPQSPAPAPTLSPTAQKPPRSPRTYCGSCGNEIMPWVSDVPAVALSVLDTDDAFEAWLDIPCRSCGAVPRAAGGRSDWS